MSNLWYNREKLQRGDLYIYTYGVYEDLTICNTFGVERAFNCDEFTK